MSLPGGYLTFDDAVGLLKSGGVLLMGTDTLPGFHCRADLAAPVARIQALKFREAGKSLLVLAGSPEQAGLATGVLDARQAAYCRLCWPGPFSLILPAGAGLDPAVNAGGATVAVRVPDLPSLRDLVLAVGFPLVSTSANLAGAAPSGDLESARAAFGDRVDGVWAPSAAGSPSGGARSAVPSALIDVTVWPPVVLRPGPVEAPPADSGGLDGGSPGV